MSAIAVAKKRGRPAFVPTEELRQSVEKMAACGVDQEAIAKALKTSVDTLARHFREELDNSSTKANTKVAGFLFENAKAGNVTAQIFWLKTRARWRETPTLHEITGANGGPLEVVYTLLNDIDAKQREPKVIEHEPAKEHGDG